VSIYKKIILIFISRSDKIGKMTKKRGYKNMMKRILSMMLATVLMLSMTACGGSGEEAGTTAEKSDFKVGLVTDVGGVEDQSFNQSAWEGLKRAEEELGISVAYLTSTTDADYAPNIETFVDEEYDLIVCVGYMLAEATREAAENYPDQQFAIVDDTSNADLENVSCLMFRAEQASYLVGYVAGMMTEKDTVGLVLGMASDTMHLFGYGYTAGVLDANPNAKILQANANSFGDPALGSTLATNFITNDADVIFHAAAATGTGVITECDAKGAMAIGVDSDQNYLAPETVITSAMKRVDNAVYSVCEKLVNGTLDGGVTMYDITNEGVDIAPTTTLLPEEVITAVEDVKGKIVSGEIEVPTTKEAFEAIYGDVYTLD
jgi:basic membrane protein A